MGRFIAFRLAQSVLVMVIVYTVTFWLLMLRPGDPFLGERAASDEVRNAIADRYGLGYLKKSPEDRAKMTAGEKFGAMSTAYVTYVGRLFKGDAPTIAYPDWTVNQVIRESLPVSVALGSLALVLALWMGVAAGTVGAMYKGRWPDFSLTVLTLFGVSLPTFAIGSGLLMLFAVVLPIFPGSGWGRLSQLVLPALTLALFFMAYIARLTRVGVLDVISADYVRTARAKGVGARQVITKHVLANASLPVLTYLGPAAAYVLTGSFVVESLFNIPGLGTHFVNSCINADIPLVLGTVVVYTALVVVFNLIIDVAYAFVDPRISVAGA